MIITVITHAAFLIFLIGIAIRIWGIAAMPVHVRWELYPVPDGVFAKTWAMLSEILLLGGVRKHNPSLWPWSWLFHVALYLMIGVTFLAQIAPFSGNLLGVITSIISVLSFAAFVCGIAGTSGLIIMRLANSRLRPMTTFYSHLNLALLFAIFLTGLAHSLAQPGAASIMIAQAGNFISLSQAPLLHPLAFAHLCLISVFASYLPFTHMAHMVLKYFTYHSVRWDERPASRLPGYAERLKKYLAYPVKWSAPHIQSGTAKRSWMDAIIDAKEEKRERH